MPMTSHQLTSKVISEHAAAKNASLLCYIDSYLTQNLYWIIYSTHVSAL